MQPESMQELSKAIYEHLVKVAKNTKIEGKVEKKKKKSTIASAATAISKSALVHVPGTPEEVVEINGHLFFFFHPATIVRWPKPGLEFKDFTVRIEPRGSEEEVKGQLLDKDKSVLTNLALKHTEGPFRGEFWIDEDGTLHLIQPAAGRNPETGKPFGIDVVLLGNPGPEQASNGPC